MKKHVFLIVLLASSLSFFLSCNKEEVNDLSGPGTVMTTGSVQLPSSFDADGLKIISGLNTGSVANGAFKINLNENTVQLLMVLNSDGQPILMSVDHTGSQSSGDEISAEKTAESLVFLNPFICTSDHSEAAELKQTIRSLSSFSNLVIIIDSQLQAGTFSLSETNNVLTEALDVVYTEIAYVLDSKKKSVNLENVSDLILSPDFEVNGLKIINVVENESDLHSKWPTGQKDGLMYMLTKVRTANHS